MTFTEPLTMDSIEYTGAEQRLLHDVLLDQGVIDVDSGALEVTERGAGANLSVDVAVGDVAILGDSVSDEGIYIARNQTTINKTIDAADPSNPRIDLVVAQVFNTGIDGSGFRKIDIDVVTGTPAADPDVPDLPDSAVPLAEVAVPANDTAITNSQITDRRTPARLARALDATPVGSLQPYYGNSAPSPEWLVCNGQAVSRTTYAALHAHMQSLGYPAGDGDGASTFNVPDLRGRVLMAMDDLGGTSANRVTAAAADTLGGTLGAEKHTLTTAELAAHAHTASSDNDIHNHTTGSDSHSHGGSTGNDSHSHTYATQGPASSVSHGHPGSGNKIAGSSGAVPTAEGVVSSSSDSHTHSVSTDSDSHTHSVGNDTHNHGVTVNNAGGGSPHNNMQPSMAVGFLIRAL